MPDQRLPRRPGQGGTAASGGAGRAPSAQQGPGLRQSQALIQGLRVDLQLPFLAKRAWPGPCRAGPWLLTQTTAPLSPTGPRMFLSDKNE